MVARDMHNTIMEIVGRYSGATELGLISERVDVWINQIIDEFVMQACLSKKFYLIDSIITTEEITPKVISSNKLSLLLRGNIGTQALTSDKSYIVKSPILILTDDTTKNSYLNETENVDSEFIVIANPTNQDLSDNGATTSEVGSTFKCTKNFNGLTNIVLGRVYHQNSIIQIKNTTIISGELYELDEGITNYRVHSLIGGSLAFSTICNSKTVLQEKTLNIRPLVSINTDRVNPFVNDTGLVYATKFDNQLMIYPTMSGVKNLNLTYVRYPAVVKLETENSPGSNDCDLPELYQNQICSNAAELILRKFNLKSDKQ